MEMSNQEEWPYKDVFQWDYRVHISRYLMEITILHSTTQGKEINLFDAMLM